MSKSVVGRSSVSRRCMVCSAALAAMAALCAPAWADDCDGNGVQDPEDLAGGAADVDGDHNLDICETRAGNLNLDGQVDGEDLLILLVHFGETGAVVADLNGDSIVDSADLGGMLAAWGSVAYSPDGPDWAIVLDWNPDPAVVFSASLRNAITATGLPWRVIARDDWHHSDVEMLLVPPDTFMMGCPEAAPAWCDDEEHPAHSVTLTEPFYIGRYEVTQKQFTDVVGWNPSHFRNGQGGLSWELRPVEHLDWETAQLFMENTGLRFPTEAEWEYAYRGGTTTTFHGTAALPNGSNSSAVILGQIAWYGDGSGQPEHTHHVGGKAANGLGLHDMAGNVYEWIYDWWGLYSSAAQTNPTGPETGVFHNSRGGGYSSPPSLTTGSSRFNNESATVFTNVGFRAARNP